MNPTNEADMLRPHHRAVLAEGSAVAPEVIADRGGDPETMLKINAAYEAIRAVGAEAAS